MDSVCQTLGLASRQPPIEPRCQEAVLAVAVLCGNDFDKGGTASVGAVTAFGAVKYLLRDRDSDAGLVEVRWHRHGEPLMEASTPNGGTTRSFQTPVTHPVTRSDAVTSGPAEPPRRR